VQYTFEWNIAKARTNVRKHRISFERAAEIFLDPFMLSIPDEADSGTEERWITIGKDRNNVAVVVVHTFREAEAENTSIRIISARRATKREVKQYNSR